MKLLFFCAMVMLSSALVSLAQSTKDAAELTRMLNEFLAGAGRNNAAIHNRFWADDLIYTRSAGVRIGKVELMKGVRSAPAPKPNDPATFYTAEDIRIQQYGKAAVVAFRLIGTTTGDGKITVSQYLNTGTFIKRKGKWQAVAWQSTIIPKP
ncbi:MAG: nuclear transport factor 2 family protein [Blastocatellia bacterium]